MTTYQPPTVPDYPPKYEYSPSQDTNPQQSTGYTPGYPPPQGSPPSYDPTSHRLLQDLTANIFNGPYPSQSG